MRNAMASIVKQLTHSLVPTVSAVQELELKYVEILFEEDNPRFYERKASQGVVTKVTDSYALIDHVIFVDNSILRNLRRLNVEDKVHYSVIRRSEFETWRAETIEFYHENAWDDDATPLDGSLKLYDVTAKKFSIPNGYLQKSSIGKVIQLINQHIYVDTDEIVFDKTVVPCPFPPVLGDWLALQICYDPNGSAKPTCLQAKPSRTWKGEGRVTKLENESGVISNEIFFHFSLVPHKVPLELGDPATFIAVESSQGEFSWRAVEVTFPLKKVDPEVKPDDVSTLTELFENKHGIKLPETLNFAPKQLGEVLEQRFAVSNEESSLVLHKATFHTDGESQLDIISPVLPCNLTPNAVTWLKIRCIGKQFGASRELLVLDFGEFKIGRYVTIQGLASKSTGQPASEGPKFDRTKFADEWGNDKGFILPGQRNFKPTAFAPVRLPPFPVPKYVWNAMSRKKDDLTSLYPCLNQPLTSANYVERFRILLYLEEIETTFRLKSYDIPRGNLKHMGPYMGLDVPGLAEKRPSLLVGDAVILSNPYGTAGVKFEGFIHETRQSQVLLKFHPDFHTRYTGEDYYISFELNRTSLRRFHLAVDLAAEHLGQQVLFPEELVLRPPQLSLDKNEGAEPATKVPAKPNVAQRLFGSNMSLNDSFEKDAEITSSSVAWVNKLLNREQKLAVMRILSGQSRPLPYIIYGPPGTGKTVTVVEAILQIFLLLGDSRILVTTPSNSSADLIVERLHFSQKVLQGDVVRLNAHHRSVESLPEAVKLYAMTGEDLQKVVRHRIVVTTCSTAGTIGMLGLRYGHFSHVFIDEAGQATEAESLVPLTLIRAERENLRTKIVRKGGQIILAGDPKQLGPVLMSQYAAAYGLELSLLERLSLLPLYTRNDALYDSGYNPHLLTKLVRNYRSHPDLVSLPSELFYDKELRACATGQQDWLDELTFLPQKGVPLLFHGVRGENLQDPDSPSWYNPAETYQAVRYLQAVLNAGIDPSEVGIITPYRKQVQKIRNLMESFGLEKVKIGSVEEFQGQERDVIIVSTVRSSSDLVTGDLVHSLGFVKSPKRFNVTITRAKSLLVVVGNPHLLAQDQYWGKFLQLCIAKRGYVGCDLPFHLSTFAKNIDE